MGHQSKKKASSGDQSPRTRASARTPAREPEGKPRKHGRLVNRAELAELYGLTPPAITRWVRSGCPYVEAGGRGREWRFNTAEVAEWRERQAYANALGDSSDWSLDEARRRREAAEAAKAEMELAKARGEIVEIEAVADIVGDDYSRVRARLLAIPPKCAPLVYRAESVAEVREILDDGCREALAELSSIAGELGEGDSEGTGEKAEASAETDRKRVGRS